jgi:hypothetical protein
VHVLDYGWRSKCHCCVVVSIAKRYEKAPRHDVPKEAAELLVIYQLGDVDNARSAAIFNHASSLTNLIMLKHVICGSGVLTEEARVSRSRAATANSSGRESWSAVLPSSARDSVWRPLTHGQSTGEILTTDGVRLHDRRESVTFKMVALSARTISSHTVRGIVSEPF